MRGFMLAVVLALVAGGVRGEWVIPTQPAGPIVGPPGSNGVDGANGANGQAATIAIAWVSNGVPGSGAIVTNLGTTNAARFGFVVPVGSNGVAGAQGPAGSNSFDSAAASNVAENVNGLTGFIPTAINYATNIVLDLTAGNLRTLVLNGPTTLHLPGRSTNRVEWVRVDLLAGTNVLTLATNNVTGVSAVTIASNGWTSLYFTGKGTTNAWEVFAQ